MRKAVICICIDKAVLTDWVSDQLGTGKSLSDTSVPTEILVVGSFNVTAKSGKTSLLKGFLLL